MSDDERGVYYTADLIISDGSDTGPDGDPTMEGDGSHAESGWIDLDWSGWQVWENREGVRPDEWDPKDYEHDDEDPNRDPVVWLVDAISKRFEGWVEDDSGYISTIYDGGEYTHPYEGKSRRLAAHPYGFSQEEIERAMGLFREQRRKVNEDSRS